MASYKRITPTRSFGFIIRLLGIFINYIKQLVYLFKYSYVHIQYNMIYYQYIRYNVVIRYLLFNTLHIRNSKYCNYITLGSTILSKLTATRVLVGFWWLLSIIISAIYTGRMENDFICIHIFIIHIFIMYTYRVSAQLFY